VISRHFFISCEIESYEIIKGSYYKYCKPKASINKYCKPKASINVLTLSLNSNTKKYILIANL